MLTPAERAEATLKIAKGQLNIERLLASELPLDLIYMGIRIQARINHRLALKLVARK